VDVGVRMTEVILHRLRFSNEDAAQIVALVKNHMRFGDVMEMRQATLKRFLRMPKFEEHLALHKMDATSSNGDLSKYEFAKQHFEDDPAEEVRAKPFVNGRDLILAGYRPGTQFKEMLEMAEDAQLDGLVSSREETLALLRERFGAPPQAFTTLTSA
jgi:poly(A) polymerase